MIVDCALYDEGTRRSGRCDARTAAREAGGDRTMAWIGLHEPEREELDDVTREFGLHELAVEDAVKAHQRPKLELYGDTLFVVLKTARYVDSEEVVELGEVQMFVGAGFAVTVRHGPTPDLSGVRRELEADPDRLAMGPGAVLHAVLDRVVDEYAPAIDGLENDIEEVEAEVFSDRRSDGITERIYKLKREVLEFGRGTSPLVAELGRLAEGRHEHVPASMRPYFRDVTDHLIRVHEQLEAFRDVLTSVLSANLAQVGVRQNEDMRKISAWVAIAVLPTLIAGVYGMNFDHMPELRLEYGYPAVLVAMAVLCGGLYRAFKRAGWL